MKKKHKKIKKSKSKHSKKSKNKQKRNEFVNFLPLTKMAEAAIYYGFTPTRPIEITADDSRKAASLKDSWTRNPADMPWLFSQDFVKERIALLREYTEKNLNSLPQPIMFIHESDTIKERSKATINLEVIGTTRSIAEALLIKTAISMLKDNGYEDFLIEINSLGDRESMNKFSRELTNYYKKHINSLSAHCRQNFKKDPFYLLHCEKCDIKNELKDNAPTSISCLSD